MGEWYSFAEVEAGAIYQTEKRDDCHEEKAAMF
jgi:hypothetical protein